MGDVELASGGDGERRRRRRRRVREGVGNAPLCLVCQEVEGRGVGEMGEYSDFAFPRPKYAVAQSGFRRTASSKSVIAPSCAPDATTPARDSHNPRHPTDSSRILLLLRPPPP